MMELLPWFAVLGQEDDFLEHLYTVQVSQTTRESFLAKDIYLRLFKLMFWQFLYCVENNYQFADVRLKYERDGRHAKLETLIKIPSIEEYLRWFPT
jgi:hypothetical protein